MASTNALTAREAYARDTCAAMLTESADARVQWPLRLLIFDFGFDF